jgi:hypothetical protein
MATRFTVRDKWTYYLAVGILYAFFTFFGVAFVVGPFLVTWPDANNKLIDNTYQDSAKR